jgi:ATP-binding cassette subfamily C protein LapB
MNRILKRLFSSKRIAIDLILSSFLANSLALIPPIFVILVLQKYVSYGIDSTLITLASGTVIAIAMEYIIRRSRYGVAERLNRKLDHQLDNYVFTAARKTKLSYLRQIPENTIRGMFFSVDQIRQIFSASNTCIVLDAPFAIIFIIALYFISPLICYLTVGVTLCLSAGVLIQLNGLRTVGQEFNKTNSLKNQVCSNVISAPDSVRIFDHVGYLQEKWEKYSERLFVLQSHLLDRQDKVQTSIRAASALLTVIVISAGGMLVVDDKLDVGAMIGANILAARVLVPIVAFFQQADGWVRAEQAYQTLSDFDQIPLESSNETSIKNYSGSLEFRNASYHYPSSRQILFENLDFSVGAGEVLCIYGKNGAGKSTLAKIISGIIEPTNGYVSVDGINLQQLSPYWWRETIIYLPQEPQFLDGSIRDNFLAYKSDLNSSDIRKLLESVGLNNIFDKTVGGLDQLINGGGTHMSLGVRRRLALARALAYDGPLVILDEPTEGIDSLSANDVYNIMTDLSHRGKTLIVCSRDREIMRGSHHFIDLDEKPKPIMKTVK